MSPMGSPRSRPRCTGALATASFCAKEHPANIYPWYGISRKFGVKVKNVSQSGGTVPLRSILDNMDSSCRAVAVSAVSFAPGFCFPIAELGAECRQQVATVLAGVQAAMIKMVRWIIVIAPVAIAREQRAPLAELPFRSLRLLIKCVISLVGKGGRVV